MDNFFQKLPKFKACCGIWLIVILAIILTPILNKLEIDLTLIGGAFTGLITFCAMIFIEEKQKERWLKENILKKKINFTIELSEKSGNAYAKFKHFVDIFVLQNVCNENDSKELLIHPVELLDELILSVENLDNYIESNLNLYTHITKNLNCNILVTKPLRNFLKNYKKALAYNKKINDFIFPEGSLSQPLHQLIAQYLEINGKTRLYNTFDSSNNQNEKDLISSIWEDDKKSKRFFELVAEDLETIFLETTNSIEF